MNGRRKLAIAVLSLLAAMLPIAARAQGISYSNVVLATFPPGGIVPDATIRVCTEPATGTPCTPLASIYSDAALTVPLSNPFTATSQGFYTFYAAAGTYHVQLSGPNVAVTDIPYIYLGSAAPPLPWETLSFSATPTFAANAYSGFSMTLTGNVTGSTVSGAYSGQSRTFDITQDATGGRTFVWPANFVNAPVVTTAANASTVATFAYDGTSWNLAPNAAGTFSATSLTAASPALGPSSLVQSSGSTTMDAVGDSITYGDDASPLTDSYSYLVANKFNWTANNTAVSGSMLGDNGFVGNMFNSTVTDTSLTVTDCCKNDDLIYGTSQTEQQEFQAGLAAFLAYAAIPTANIIGANSSAVTYAGSGWTACTPWPTAPPTFGCEQTAHETDTATFTVTGSTVYVTSLSYYGDAAAFSVTVDGTNYGPATYSEDGAIASTTIQHYAYYPLMVRIPGLSDTPHTVVVTAVGATSGQPVYFLWAASPTNAATSTGPFVYVGNEYRQPSAGYTVCNTGCGTVPLVDGNGTASDTSVGEFDARIAQTVSELAADGLNVQLVNVWGALTTADISTSDNIHPTTAGHAKMAVAYETAINQLQYPSDRGVQPNWSLAGATVDQGRLCFGCVNYGLALPGTRGDLILSEGTSAGCLYLGQDGNDSLCRSGSVDTLKNNLNFPAWELPAGTGALMASGAGFVKLYGVFQGWNAGGSTQNLAFDGTNGDTGQTGFPEFAESSISAPTSAFLFAGTPTAIRTITWPDASGTVALSLSGTTGTITGTSLSASCDSGTASVTGAVVGSPVAVSTTDGTDVGGAFYLRASVTSAGTVTVYVCGTGTPPSKAYNVRVIQ